MIDGIRHREVLESLKSLVGPERFRLAFVNRPEDVRRTLLLKEEGITQDTVGQVMNDQTEREIFEISGRANLTLDAEGDRDYEADRLMQLVPS